MQLFRALAACSLVACAFAQQSLTSLLSSNTNLSEFNSLLKAFPNVLTNLSTHQGVTIFAPSNAAFAELNYTVLAPAFTSYNLDFQRALIYYHAVNGIHPSGSFSGGRFSFLPTLLTNSSYTNITGGAVLSIVEQAGNLFVAVSGLGVRTTLNEVVSTVIVNALAGMLFPTP